MDTLWFIKSRRAKDVEDYETWVEAEVTPTLNAFDNNGDTRSTVLIFYTGTFGEVRVQGNVINTLPAKMGTGGNNTPMMVFPIQDGRGLDKKQNGLGLGNENDPAYTLDTVGGQAVAYPIQGTIIGRSDTAGPQGKGFGDSTDPMYTIDTVGGNAVATPAMVRRLTPLECERLQGFPDNWTASQSDSQRYKQMGNAVAVPVVQWIIDRLVDVEARLNADVKGSGKGAI